jgi:hypothetical protein
MSFAREAAHDRRMVRTELLQTALRPDKGSAVCIPGKSKVGLQQPGVKRVSIPAWFLPNRPIPLPEQQLWTFQPRTSEDGFAAPRMLSRLWHVLG